jgi:hypothetical protein
LQLEKTRTAANQRFTQVSMQEDRKDTRQGRALTLKGAIAKAHEENLSARDTEKLLVNEGIAADRIEAQKLIAKERDATSIKGHQIDAGSREAVGAGNNEASKYGADQRAKAAAVRGSQTSKDEQKAEAQLLRVATDSMGDSKTRARAQAWADQMATRYPDNPIFRIPISDHAALLKAVANKAPDADGPDSEGPDDSDPGTPDIPPKK